jgi:hypothetical protein
VHHDAASAAHFRFIHLGKLASIHLIELATFCQSVHGFLNGCLSIGSGGSFSIVHSNAWIGLKSSSEPNSAVSNSERNEDLSVVNQETRQITPMTIRL